MKTSFNKLSDIQKKWYIVDIENLPLGRVLAQISLILRGKNKANYTPFLDCGDNVIIINADKVKLTGKKWNNKIYYWHTGYPGGIKEASAKKMKEKSVKKLIMRAITGMIPAGPLGRKQLKNLYIYEGTEHPHQAQSPIKINILK